MPAISQTNRNLGITTELGEDQALILNATINEQLGRLFQIDVDLISEDPAVEFDKIVGTSATIRLELPGNKEPRHFNGLISHFSQTEADQTGGKYHATIVPWLWFLTRTSDCRIFQQKTVPDIIKEVFRGRGFNDFKDSLSGNYTAWDYCVQYRETDFNFVSRLMEQEGIYYFFEHEDGKHTLVLSDGPSAHMDFPGYEEINFRSGRSGVREQEYIDHWVLEQEVQPGTYALNDFNFETPKTSIAAQSNISTQHAQSAFEIYDYPGSYGVQGQGTAYSRLRIEEMHAQHEIVSGHGNARGLAAGYTFTLDAALRRDQNRKYIVTSASYQLTSDTYQSGAKGDSAEFYSCSFKAIDATKPFRTQRTTPKPIIQGPQTAIVVGPKGEEIHTDKYGRIKVQFHWDRYSKADENSSCWLRVSQAAWAGKKWGAMYIPRIGQEVIVEFLEGDPDRPIVTGRVYNADAMPPYPLPDEKTKTTLKSNSSKGGNGFNEIRFEDKKGHEQVFIHGERNLDIRVKHDRLEAVGNDYHLKVANDKFENIDGKRHEEVSLSHFEKICQDRNLTVVGKDLVDITGSQSVKIAEDMVYEVTGNVSEKVGKKFTLVVTDDLVIQSSASITIKVEGSSIAIDASGITLTAKTIELKASSALKMDGGLQASLKATKTEVSGDASLDLKSGGPATLKGATVGINS